MASLVKHSAGFGGSGLTWTSCGFTASDFNSRADGSVVVAATAITNATDLDILIDVSMQAEVGGTTAVTSYFSLYLLPLQQDGASGPDHQHRHEDSADHRPELQ